MKSVKTIRVQIIKPITDDWIYFGWLLRDIQYKTWKLKNKSIQLAWEWNCFQSDYSDLNGNFPKEKDMLGVTLPNFIYRQTKQDYGELSSDLLGQTIRIACDRFNTDKKDVMNGRKSIASFRRDCPIELRNKNVRLREENGVFIADLSLLSREYAKELGKKSGQIPVMLFSRDNSTTTILRRMINGEYKLGASRIVRRGRKWFLNISYTFESWAAKVPKNTDVMGIDLGIVHAAYIAFNESRQRYFIEGSEIKTFKQRIERRRNEMLRQGKYCGEGRRGHGRKTRLKPIEKLQGRVANFRDTTNHKYSRYIVDLAVKHGVYRIQMEDLSGIKDQRERFLQYWTYYDLQQKIEYKAKEHGIEVVKINPKYTSQRCHKCGHIDERNRKDQATFECVSCGNKCNADYNAAKNIATPGIESIIENELRKVA